MNLASFYRDVPVAPCPLATLAYGFMEDLFEFLFNATGRINRAKYWRSLVIFGVAGLFAAVILFTAAGIAAPLFVAMLVVVLIPWLTWGFVIHTERFVPGRPGLNAVHHPGAGRICALDVGIF